MALLVLPHVVSATLWICVTKLMESVLVGVQLAIKERGVTRVNIGSNYLTFTTYFNQLYYLYNIMMRII